MAVRRAAGHHGQRPGPLAVHRHRLPHAPRAGDVPAVQRRRTRLRHHPADRGHGRGPGAARARAAAAPVRRARRVRRRPRLPAAAGRRRRRPPVRRPGMPDGGPGPVEPGVPHHPAARVRRLLPDRARRGHRGPGARHPGRSRPRVRRRFPGAVLPGRGRRRPARQRVAVRTVPRPGPHRHARRGPGFRLRRAGVGVLLPDPPVGRRPGRPARHLRVRPRPAGDQGRRPGAAARGAPGRGRQRPGRPGPDGGRPARRAAGPGQPGRRRAARQGGRDRRTTGW